jgi:hypothetical protein
MKTLLVINGTQQELEIETFEISSKKYDGFDLVLILDSPKEELVAEGVTNPTKSGIGDVETEYPGSLDSLNTQHLRDDLRIEMNVELEIVEEEIWKKNPTPAHKITTKEYDLPDFTKKDAWRDTFDNTLRLANTNLVEEESKFLKNGDTLAPKLNKLHVLKAPEFHVLQDKKKFVIIEVCKKPVEEAQTSEQS